MPRTYEDMLGKTLSNDEQVEIEGNNNIFFYSNAQNYHASIGHYRPLFWHMLNP